MAGKSNFIDADSNIFEENLRFVRNDLEDGLKQYFGGSQAGEGGVEVVAPPRDFKVVTPKPGFCIKSFKVNTNEKYFINVCQTIEIPSPEDISDEQLKEILQSDAPSSFRIPMSISEPRITKDKSDKTVDVCDIAINPKFFAKCEKSFLFKDFFLTLIAEALSDKYNVQIKMDKSIILNNRKFIGTLVSHRIRNNDVKTVLKSYQNPTDDDKDKLKHLSSSSTTMKPLVEEVDENEIKVLKQKAEQIGKLTSSSSSMEPKFELRAKLKGENVDEICAEFYLPKCISSQEITLDIGEDRILLESKKHGYLFDKFINSYSLNQDRVNAIFDKTNKMLQVRIPVMPVK